MNDTSLTEVGDPIFCHDSPDALKVAGFNLTNAEFREVTPYACISSRITTVIQVINKPSNKP